MIKIETEIWKDIKHYPGIRNDMYQISNLGRVREKYTKRIKKLCPSEKGYLRTAFIDENGDRSIKKIHRIVAVHFVPNDDPVNKVEVDHKDCKKTNNRADNLEWVTHYENIQRAKKNGLIKPPKGVDHYRTYLTEEQVEYICKLLVKEKSAVRVYRKLRTDKAFRVTKYTIWNIWRKQTWRHVSDKYF